MQHQNRKETKLASRTSEKQIKVVLMTNKLLKTQSNIGEKSLNNLTQKIENGLKQRVENENC